MISNLYKKIKKILYIFTCCITKYRFWITIPNASAFIIFSAWTQFANIKILSFRPTDETFFYVLILTPIIGALFNFLQMKSQELKISSIKTRNKEQIKLFKDQLYIEKLLFLEDHLREISEHLEFTMQERICVYMYVQENNEEFFKSVGRYSHHNDYNQPSRREKKYSSEYGIIADVWKNGQNNGFRQDNQIPSYTKKPNKKHYDYLEKEYNIPKDISKHFRMNPVDIIAEVIRDNKGKSIGVIIFESQRAQFLDMNKIQTFYTPIKKGGIVNSLEKLNEEYDLPNLSIATEVDL